MILNLWRKTFFDWHHLWKTEKPSILLKSSNCEESRLNYNKMHSVPKTLNTSFHAEVIQFAWNEDKLIFHWFITMESFYFVQTKTRNKERNKGLMVLIPNPNKVVMALLFPFSFKIAWRHNASMWEKYRQWLGDIKSLIFSLPRIENNNFPCNNSKE